MEFATYTVLEVQVWPKLWHVTYILNSSKKQ